MSNEYLVVGTKVGIYSLVCLLAHWPSNWAVRKTIRRWKPEEEAKGRDKRGALIGTLERILIIILIGAGSFTAVGFVAAMKSIARYDKIQKQKAFAEYFLAGTMLSILIALVLALLAKTTARFATK